MALLEEHDLKGFFRAIRGERTDLVQIEQVNIELDRGISLMEIFGPLGPLSKHMLKNWLELDVIRLD